VSLAAIVAEKALSPSLPREVPAGAGPYDVVLHALSVMCGADAAGVTSVQLKTAMFRARARQWFRGGQRAAKESKVSETLKEELARIESEIKALEERKRAIYQRSLDAPEGQKICEDWVAKMLAEEPWPSFAFPIEVTGIAWSESPMLRPPLLGRRTTWVAVRPCEGDGKRTYLGFLLGDMALGTSVRFDRESGVLSVSPAMHNPAIWVPDLGRIVMGCGSWWGPVKGPEDLRKITDADINDVWYVRALKDLSKAATPGAPAEPGDAELFQALAPATETPKEPTRPVAQKSKPRRAKKEASEGR
jgi:hypothetical protein